jgi:hypothetical protein
MVGELVFQARRDDHHIARPHSGTLSADLCGEFACDEQKDLIAVLVSFRLLTRRLPWSKLHHRGLASLRRLQDFEPLGRSIDVLSFHGTIHGSAAQCDSFHATDFAPQVTFACGFELLKSIHGQPCNQNRIERGAFLNANSTKKNLKF